MRIRVLDFFPHINGMTTYAKHACIGLRQLGIDAAVTSFSKSGKAPESWGAPDVNKHGGRASHIEVHETVKWSEAAAYLKTLDGVVLNEPRNTILDNAATKEYDDPPYIEALAKSQVPWTCMIGCPQYTPDYAPFLEDLVKQTNIKGAIVAFPSFVPPSFVEHDMRIIFSNKYPYEREVHRSAKTFTQSVSVAGRIAGNKGGWTSLFAVLDQLPTNVTYDLYGTCGRGVGPSTIIQMIEALTAQYGVKRLQWLNGNQEWLPFRNDAVSIELKTGHHITYYGGFMTSPFFGLTPKVVVNLSSASFTTGTLEYVGLEALDAGCALVTAPHLLAGDTCYDVFVADEHYENAVMKKIGFTAKKGESKTSLVSLVHRIKDALHEDDIYAHNRRETNYATLLLEHDPKKHATLLLAALSLVDLPSFVEQRTIPSSEVPALIKRDKHVFEEYKWNPAMWHHAPATSLLDEQETIS